jgi:flagellar motility protein MotE (MotC chaperone)
MNTEDVRSILYLMPPETAGAILGKMKPEKAAQIASLQVGK